MYGDAKNRGGDLADGREKDRRGEFSGTTGVQRRTMVSSSPTPGSLFPPSMEEVPVTSGPRWRGPFFRGTAGSGQEPRSS